jgi:indolepyruvate ferredoxin oxidoreductase
LETSHARYLGNGIRRAAARRWRPPQPVPLNDVSLDDKYTATSGKIFLSGIQALVRLPLMQRKRDEAAGLNTAGFISGYRGSPLGGLDETCGRRRSTWMRTMCSSCRRERGPGRDRRVGLAAGGPDRPVQIRRRVRHVVRQGPGRGPLRRRVQAHEPRRHGAHGGVLLVAGDDHGAYSSTLPHQSDHIFSACMIPVLYPCNVQEYLDLGVHGWAMSRFSGCAVAFKALADTVESSSSVDADPFRVQVKLPHDFHMPEGGLNARLSNVPLGRQARNQEALMQDYKIYAALAYARENRLNHTTIDNPDAKLGIIASGKSYLDVLEALEELGIDEAMAAQVGLRLFKVAMPWPLEPDSVREFAQGLDEILVVEEKRQFVEYQLKEQLYNWRDDVRPRVIGKFDDKGEWVAPRGEWLLPPKADFSVSQVARVIASRIKRYVTDPHVCDQIKARLVFLDAKDAVLQKAISTPFRPAFYCSGCPHNTSTKVPEGSFALAGIGCHVMATSIYPEMNKLTTHMGGEGAPWIGQAAFSTVPHVFQNLGDGTYFHSGYLAIRAAVAARVNITYKILYNDAVAMTGGQPVDGTVSVPMIAQQMAAEGIRRIALVTEDLSRYDDRSNLPAFVTLHDRKDIDAVQRELRELPGCTVLIYDQTCAAEKAPAPEKEGARRSGQAHGDQRSRVRRLRRLRHPVQLRVDPAEGNRIRPQAHDRPVQLQQGLLVRERLLPELRDRGGRHAEENKRARRPAMTGAPAREPMIPACERPYNILINGIGGTGVITVGALMGMAAHLEGKGASVLDMTGMSQKNGSVTSHVKIVQSPAHLRAQRIATGEADLVLGCDMLTTGAADAVSKMRPGRTLAVVNLHEQPPGTFAQERRLGIPGGGRARADRGIGGRPARRSTSSMRRNWPPR